VEDRNKCNRESRVRKDSNPPKKTKKKKNKTRRACHPKKGKEKPILFQSGDRRECNDLQKGKNERENREHFLRGGRGGKSSKTTSGWCKKKGEITPLTRTLRDCLCELRISRGYVKSRNAGSEVRPLFFGWGGWTERGGNHFLR